MNDEKNLTQRMKDSAILSRLCIYCLGLLCVSIGITLCAKCQLGLSPISSIPYVLKFIVPLSFGTLTMLFHLLNSLIQYILEKKAVNIKVLLQVPVAVLFGVVLDWLDQVIVFDAGVAAYRWIALLLSIFFTALGMVFMVDMELVQNPPDGTVNRISSLLHTDMGKVKNIYDVTCVVVSIAVSLIFLRRVEGFGAATIASAIFVGRTLSLLQRSVGDFLKKKVTF